MKTGKIVTGVAVGVVVALILIPKTRRMINDAVCSITDSIKDLANKAKGAAENSKEEVNKFADKAKDFAGNVKATKEAWQ